jgi:rRNA maturation protein Nop10
MEDKRKAKRCPKCGTMTFVDRDRCQNCGHQFRTDVVAAPASFNPERTQMLVLPPNFHREVKPPEEAEDMQPFAYIEPVAPRRASRLPLIAILTVVTLLMIAFTIMLIRSAIPMSR